MAHDDGFSLIELLIAIMLLAGGILSLVSTLDGSRALSNTGERVAAATAVAEQQIERYTSRQYRYSQVGMLATPALTTARETNDPTTGYPDEHLCSTTTYRWDQTPCTGANPDGDTIVGSGLFDPVEDWDDARSGARGVVHTYVTQVNDDCPDALRTGACADVLDFKRITVAVSVKNGPPDEPVVLTALIADPDALPACPECQNPYLIQGLEY